MQSLLKSQLPFFFFVEIGKIHMKCKRPKIAHKNVLKKSWGLTLLDLKTYYKATMINTVFYWHNNRHIDQWKRTKTPEINAISWSIDFLQFAKVIQWRKNNFFNKWCWYCWISACKRMKSEFQPYTKNTN